MGVRFSAPVQTGPGAHPASCTMGTGVLPEGKEGPGRDAVPSPATGRTACTEPQCLYKGALYLTYVTLFYFDKPSVISAQRSSLLSLMAYVHFIHKCVSICNVYQDI